MTEGPVTLGILATDALAFPEKFAVATRKKATRPKRRGREWEHR
jgi:hypothetical protein